MNKDTRIGLIVFAIFVIPIAIYSYYFRYKVRKLPKIYTVGKTIDIGTRPLSLKFEFYYKGRIIKTSQVIKFQKVEMDKWYIVEVPIGEEKSSKLLLNKPVSNSIVDSVPLNGWKQIPEEYVLKEN